MKLALIPPLTCIGAIGHTDYQLLLPQLVTSSSRYVKAYHRRRREGDFMILDNGAAEGVETSPEELHKLAHHMMVNEIVIPDTLLGVEDTIAKARSFKEHASNKFRYMAVVQGTTLAECFECIREFAELEYIHTIGIPRHLITTLEQDARFRIVAYIHRLFAADFSIHLLGMNPKFPDELVAFGSIYRTYGVRGVDTSMPFSYATAGASLLEADKCIPRPENYFEAPSSMSGELMYTNITLMKDWTYGLR